MSAAVTARDEAEREAAEAARERKASHGSWPLTGGENGAGRGPLTAQCRVTAGRNCARQSSATGPAEDGVTRAAETADGDARRSSCGSSRGNSATKAGELAG